MSGGAAVKKKTLCASMVQATELTWSEKEKVIFQEGGSQAEEEVLASSKEETSSD